MDGNFSLAPALFSQLYVIHAPLASTYVTCAYALMAGKSQDEYQEMLQAVVAAIRQTGFDADPDVIITHFEQAVFDAAATVLGNHAIHRGCFYHLTQATWRKVLHVSSCLIVNITRLVYTKCRPGKGLDCEVLGSFHSYSLGERRKPIYSETQAVVILNFQIS